MAAAAVAGGAAIASAALADPSPSPSTSASGAPTNPKGAPGRPLRGGFRGPGGPGLGVGPALHGEFVVAKPGGGYQTIDTQQGDVTAVSNSSITVKSADGFTRTYSVTDKTLVDAQRNGIGSVKVGDQVTISATVDGGTATATDIVDRSQVRAAHPRPSQT
jgi:hypothetical protein